MHAWGGGWVLGVGGCEGGGVGGGGGHRDPQCDEDDTIAASDATEMMRKGYLGRQQAWVNDRRCLKQSHTQQR